ncbi:MAG: cytidine deaminase [Firmicutes bacterium]|nr:cytidine deaminase [Bacillota bacterium]
MEQLLAAARAAQEKSYSPYSRYPVGAAVRATSGKIYTGCNIENASYGLTICAERVALATAVAAGEREFTALAIAAGDGDPGMPCGACRQFMAEWFTPDVPIVVVSGQGQRLQMTMGQLLPYAFGPKSLGEGPR